MRAFSSATIGWLFALVLFSAPAFSGCSDRRVERRETTETVTDHSGSVGSDYHRTETEKSTEVEHEHSSGSSCSGVLSCAVHALGEVLLFPFRAIGYLFQALF